MIEYQNVSGRLCPLDHESIRALQAEGGGVAEGNRVGSPTGKRIAANAVSALAGVPTCSLGDQQKIRVSLPEHHRRFTLIANKHPVCAVGAGVRRGIETQVIRRHLEHCIGMVRVITSSAGTGVLCPQVI